MAFRVSEADAALLPATHARSIPVESINAPKKLVATAKAVGLPGITPKDDFRSSLLSLLIYYNTCGLLLPKVLLAVLVQT